MAGEIGGDAVVSAILPGVRELWRKEDEEQGH
jgi:hypothetical protein